ncbi:hypothetical protein FRB91_006299 [Serendipita sp. 411]|nr:hypothetical protein FRB91_006299 [Serendipita sp. 411]
MELLSGFPERLLALDADHISAIDNATRGLINLGQLPTTCGLFFSLGHSTIVVAFIIAIAISSDVYDRAGGFGDVGGIIGASISGSFLFIIGTVNSVILYRIIQDRRRIAGFKKKGLPVPEESEHIHTTFLVRILSPITKIVDRPWKMYPVGVLFGLGFDTASSIALLAVSALAKRDAQGKGIPTSSIVILPLLFTSGMTLIDSLDSVLMLYSYSGFPEKGWALFRRKEKEGGKQAVKRSPSLPRFGNTTDLEARPAERVGSSPKHSKDVLQDDQEATTSPVQIVEDDGHGHDHDHGHEEDEAEVERKERAIVLKNNSMSTLSILLTLVSILLAYAISLITIMSLIGEQCRKCRDAAEADEGRGGGLAGSWWRAWARAADASGYIGAGLVGAFALLVAGWYLVRYVVQRKRGEEEQGSVS